jgi:short-subunit dehydrogenase
MEALRNRLATSGVNVVTIKPGPVDTEMTQHLSMSKMSAAKASEIILSKRGKNGEFYLSPLHRAIFYVIKRVPSPIFRKLKI